MKEFRRPHISEMPKDVIYCYSFMTQDLHKKILIKEYPQFQKYPSLNINQIIIRVAMINKIC